MRNKNENPFSPNLFPVELTQCILDLAIETSSVQPLSDREQPIKEVKNPKVSTEEYIISTYRLFHQLIQPKRLATVLANFVIAGQQKKAVG